MKRSRLSLTQLDRGACSRFFNRIKTVARFAMENTWPKVAILGLCLTGLTYVAVAVYTGPIGVAGVIAGLAFLLLSATMCFAIFPNYKLAVLMSVSLAIALGFVAWAQICRVGFWINDSLVFFTTPRQVELSFESPPKWKIESSSPAGSYSFLATTAATGIFLEARDDYRMVEDTDRPEDAPLASIAPVLAVYELPYSAGRDPFDGICLSQLNDAVGRSVRLRTESGSPNAEGQLELPADSESAMTEASTALRSEQGYSVQISSENALIMFITLFHLNERVYPVYDLPRLDLVVDGPVNALHLENDAYWYRQTESPIRTCSDSGIHHHDEVSTLQLTAPSLMNVGSMSNVSTYALLMASDIEIRQDDSVVSTYSSPVALLLQLEESSIALRWRVDASLLWQDPANTDLRARNSSYAHSAGAEVVYLVSLEAGEGSFVLDGVRYEVEAVDSIRLLTDAVDFKRVHDAYHIAARCYDLQLNSAGLIPNAYWQEIPPAIQAIVTGAIIALFGALLALAVTIRGVRLNAASKLTTRRQG